MSLNKCPKCKVGLMYYSHAKWPGDSGGYRCPLCGTYDFGFNPAVVAESTPVRPLPIKQMSLTQSVKEQHALVKKLVLLHLDEINNLFWAGGSWEDVAKFLFNIDPLVGKRGDRARSCYNSVVPVEKRLNPMTLVRPCECGVMLSPGSKATFCQRCLSRRRNASSRAAKEKKKMAVLIASTDQKPSFVKKVSRQKEFGVTASP